MNAGPNTASNPVDLPKRLPLVVGPENRDDTTSKDARLVNGYVETKGQETWIYPRVGLEAYQQPSGGAATGRGIYNWRGDIYSIFNGDLYRNGTDVGNVSNAGFYRFSQTLGGTPRLQLGNGSIAYNYTVAGGVVQITDADFPASFCRGWAYLDGTTYVMRTADAGIQGSDINDPINWDPLNVIIAQIQPDLGVALASQLVYVIALKQWTTEVFYDAANSAGSPLGTVQGAKVNFGAVSADSVQNIDDVLFWIATTREGPAQVIKMDKLKADVCSDKAVERLLDNADFSTVYSWSIKHDGHLFYVFTIKEENLTLVYDMSENRWSQWTDTNGNYFPIVASATGSDGVHVLQHESNGRLYRALPEFATDAGDLIQVDIYTPGFDGGVKKRKMLSRLEMVADQKAGAILQVRVNDNDYNPRSWSNFRKLDLSRRRAYITDCGSFYKRAFNFRYRQPVRMPRIQAVELDLALGTL